MCACLTKHNEHNVDNLVKILGLTTDGPPTTAATACNAYCECLECAPVT